MKEVKKEVINSKDIMNNYNFKFKPFNLEEAKKGGLVVTRNGRKVRILCFDKKDNSKNIIALIEEKTNFESIYTYYSDGRFNLKRESDFDLMMLPSKKKGYINIYKGGLMDCAHTYSTKEEALRYKDYNSEKGYEDYIDTIEITWFE